jgi:hypothetical protein
MSFRPLYIHPLICLSQEENTASLAPPRQARFTRRCSVTQHSLQAAAIFCHIEDEDDDDDQLWQNATSSYSRLFKEEQQDESDLSYSDTERTKLPGVCLKRDLWTFNHLSRDSTIFRRQWEEELSPSPLTALPTRSLPRLYEAQASSTSKRRKL